MSKCAPFLKYLQSHFSNFTAPNLVQLSLTLSISRLTSPPLVCIVCCVISPWPCPASPPLVWIVCCVVSQVGSENGTECIYAVSVLLQSLWWKFSPQNWASLNTQHIQLMKILSVSLPLFISSLSFSPTFVPSIPSSSAHSEKPIFPQYTTNLTLKQQLHTTQQLSPPRHIGLHAVPLTHQLGSLPDP